MSKLLFKNNATTTLGSAVAPSDTTITVATGTGNEFPSPTGGDYFSATLWAAGSTTGTPNEIVYVTARSGDTMTVLRAQEGTVASSWSVGDTFANYPTAAFFNGTATSSEVQAQGGNYAVDSGTANAGTVTLSPVPATLSAIIGAPIRVMKISSANTGAYTLNVNGFGAQPVKLNGAFLAAGQLPASQIFQVVWDGSTFELQSFPGNVVNAELAAMPANTAKANITGGSAVPSDVPLASFLNWLGFTGSSLGSSGYYVFPNGLIAQWGFPTSSATPNAQKPISFPIAFPNTIFNSPVISCNNNSATASITWVDSANNTGFNLRCNVALIGCQYIVLGF